MEEKEKLVNGERLSEYTDAFKNYNDSKYVEKETGKGLSSNDYTTAEKNKLAGVAEGAEVNVNADWNATGGDAQILNKPSSMPASDVYEWAKASKKPSYTPSEVGALPDTTTHLSGDVPTSRTVNGKALSSDISLTYSDVSALPDTTTHLSGDVPISRTINGKALNSDVSLSYSDVSALSNTTTHLSGDIATSEKGAANGVATLDKDGKVPSSQLPSYVDDVLEYSSKSYFPTTGASGVIYVDTTTNLTYRWSGSGYTEISPSIALGETSSTAYAGDKGKANAAAINTLNTALGALVGHSTIGYSKDGTTETISFS